MYDVLLGFLVACAFCAVVMWVMVASHHKVMELTAKYHHRYPLANGKSYYLIEESEYLELQKANRAETSDDPNSFVSGTSPDRNRRVTDAWMHDPVPSQSGFQHAIQPRPGAVGWSDDS